jgi:hypothetical protein
MENPSSKNQPLMDYVLAIVLSEASDGFGDLNEIERQIPGGPSDEISRALLSAGAIISAAHEIGIDVTKRLMSKSAAIDALEARFPGYGKESYEAVVDFGCQLS